MADINRIATLTVRVDGSGAISTFRGIEASADKATKRASTFESTIKGVVAGLGLYSGTAAIRKTLELADAYTNMNARLALVSRGTAGLTRVQQELFDQSQQSRTSLNATAELYTRMARNAQDLGKSESELLAITNTINQAMALSGGNAASQAAALVQLGQAFGAGTLRGEELNSVLEQAPVLAEAIAKGIGVTTGRLKELGAAGQLTGKQVSDALERSAASVNEQFRTMPITVGGAFTQLSNSTLKYIGEANQANGVTRTLADSITVLSKNIDGVAESAKTIAVLYGVRVAGGFIAARESSIAMYAQVLRGNAVLLDSAKADKQRGEFAAEFARAKSMAAEKDVALLKAEQVQLRELMALERQRLATANARIARAVPEASLAPLGGAVAARDNAGVVFAMKQQAESQANLNQMIERGVVLNGQIAATQALVGAETVALTLKQRVLAAATTLTATAMGVMATAGRFVLGIFGGWPGIILAAAYAVYELTKYLKNNSAEMDQNRARMATIRGETDAYAKSLDGLTVAQLKEAEARERANLAKIASQIKASAPELSAGRTFNESVSGIESKQIGQMRDLTKLQGDYNKLMADWAVSAARVNELTLARTEADKAAKVAAAQKLTEYQKEVATAKIAIERQNALNDSFFAGTRVIDDINAAYDLKSKLAAIAAEYDGAQEAALIKLAVALDGAQKANRDLTASQQARLASITALEQINDAAMTKNAQRVQLMEDIDKAKGENRANARQVLDDLQSQVDLLGKTKAELEGLLDLENQRIAASMRLTGEEAGRFVRLQRELRNAKPPVKETQEWAVAMQAVATATQGIVGPMSAAVGGVTQLINGLIRSQAAQKALKAAKDEAETAASSASQTTGYLMVAAATIGLIDTIKGLFDPTDRLRKKADELTESYRKQFDATQKLVDVRTDTPGAAAVDASSLTAAATAAFVAQARASSGRNPDQARFMQAVKDYEAALESIANATAKRVADIKQLAIELRNANEALEVRRLTASGKGDAADREQLRLSQLNEIRAAEEKFGADSPYLKSLREVHEMETSAAEAVRARIAAEKAETSRRNTFDNDNATLAFTDPRGASQAAFSEGLQRRYNDAVTRGASELELLSIEARNAAEALDFERQRRLQDERDTTSILARIASATGNTRGAEDLTRIQSNKDELEEAFRSGMSDTNRELLKFAHLVEASQVQMLRAIEDGTAEINKWADHAIAANNDLIDIIKSTSAAEVSRLEGLVKGWEADKKAVSTFYDDQIEAVRENTRTLLEAKEAEAQGTRDQLDAAKSQLSVLEKSVATAQRVYDAIGTFLDSSKLGDLSTLSPLDKKAEAQRQFDALLAQARGGNADAATALPGAANALLQAAQAFDGSTPAYVAVFNSVQSALAAVQQQFGQSLPTDVLALEAARATVSGLERQLEAINKQKEIIQRTGEAEVSRLDGLKTAAIDRLQKLIDAANEAKQIEIDNAAAAVAKYEALNEGIRTLRDVKIQELVTAETLAHQQRVEQLGVTRGISSLMSQANEDARAYYEQVAQFLVPTSTNGLTDKNTGPVSVVIEPQADSVASATLEELRATRAENRELREETRQMRAELKAALVHLANIGLIDIEQTRFRLDKIAENTGDLLDVERSRSNRPR